MLSSDDVKKMLDIENPVVISQYPIRVLKEGKKVKYEGDGSTYEGYKHSVVLLETGDEFPPTADLHSTDSLRVGMYVLAIEIFPKGKIKTKNHYIFDDKATIKLERSKATTQSSNS